jgi:hypothetical protein
VTRVSVSAASYQAPIKSLEDGDEIWQAVLDLRLSTCRRGEDSV